MSNLIATTPLETSAVERASDVLAVTSALVTGFIVLLTVAAAF
jgi:hypothetical protein